MKVAFPLRAVLLRDLCFAPLNTVLTNQDKFILINLDSSPSDCVVISAFQSYSDQIISFAERLHCEASTYFAGIQDSYISRRLDDLTSDV